MSAKQKKESADTHLCNPLSMRTPRRFTQTKEIGNCTLRRRPWRKKSMSIHPKHPKIIRDPSFQSLVLPIYSRISSYRKYIEANRYIILQWLNTSNENHLSQTKNHINCKTRFNYIYCLFEASICERRFILNRSFFNWKIYERRKREKLRLIFYSEKIYSELIEETTVKRTRGGSRIFYIHTNFVGFSANRRWSWRIARDEY